MGDNSLRGKEGGNDIRRLAGGCCCVSNSDVDGRSSVKFSHRHDVIRDGDDSAHCTNVVYGVVVFLTGD
jgi:hypothetical protein